MTQILAGSQTAGRWTGLQNFCGNIAGMVAPLLVRQTDGPADTHCWPEVLSWHSGLMAVADSGNSRSLIGECR